ncbi:MAG: hypothetical protein ACI88C_001201, partial [Acidimicrobiales bacterium]
LRWPLGNALADYLALQKFLYLNCDTVILGDLHWLARNHCMPNVVAHREAGSKEVVSNRSIHSADSGDSGKSRLLAIGHGAPGCVAVLACTTGVGLFNKFSFDRTHDIE